MALAALKQDNRPITQRFFKEVIARNWFDARKQCQAELIKTKITMTAIAEGADVSFNTVSRLRNGETVDPRGKTLINIYKVLGIRLIFE